MALTLLATPIAVQQKMDEMWDSRKQAKEINKTEEHGHLFEWENYTMFIHWGLYAQFGNVWNGKNYYGIAEWTTKINIKNTDKNVLQKTYRSDLF